MKRLLVSSLIVALLSSGQAAAAGLYFLTRSPFARFSEADRALFYARAIEALDSASDGQQVTWSNPDSTARGVITPLQTVDDEVYGRCRVVRVTNELKGQRQSGEYKACKATNGSWRVLAAGAAARE
ncbi:MAG: RT0821/Lpp0805 family surface protein [Gammaproteobacteria bacterium]|jgi:surface antigen|nr:RT0821/Lpp0805 family surface protein [Gammaproteobacteria bacterium]